MRSNCTLNTADTYTTSAEESKSSADKLALTLYPIEPKISAVEKLENFANKLVCTLFLHPIDHDISADELNYTTYAKPTASKKHLGTGLKTVSKDQCHGTAKSSWGHYPKK